MTDKILQPDRSIKTADTQTAEQQGENWIQAIIDQDFKHLTTICYPDIKSTLLLPKRIAHLESAGDLAKEVEDWFGEYDTIEIEQLRLLCSGFQPGLVSITTPLAEVLNTSHINISYSTQAIPQANALLEFKAAVGQGSTCALLTPYIKSKLNGLSSGEVLEAHVDDITAKEDIEAWSRLSGNLLLKMDQTADQELVFYIQKK